MTEWREVALGEGIEVLHGYAFKGEYFRDEGDLIVLTPGNFWDKGGFKPKSGKEKYYDGPFPPRFLLSQGDVVIAMTEQVHGLLGSSATIPTDGVYLHNQRIGLVQVTDPDALDLRFVYHLMNTRTIRQQIQATATGSKVRHTAPERIKAVRADIPDIAVQRRVASILDSIDDLIDNSRRRVEVLEEMARAIYREWFVRFRYPGHEDVPLVDSPLGPIPNGWTLAELGELAAEIRRSVKPSSDTAALPYVPIDAIESKSITLRNYRSGEEAASSLRLFQRGDVLFGAMRAYFHKVCISPFDGVTRSTCFVLRPDRERYYYSVFTLADPETVKYAAAHSTGSTIPYAKWEGVLNRMLIVAPPASLMSSFSDVVDPLLRAGRPLVEQARQLAALRDLLLPKLVTGQIDVSHLDIDALTEAATA